MLAEQRFTAILEILNRNQAVTVSELCRIVGASESTIRRDLSALAKQGRLNKVHGGATAAEGEFLRIERDMTTKAGMYVEEKDRIARYAARQISDDDFVFIDAGTTTQRMVDYLTTSKATFVTNGIGVARRMVEKGLRAYILGGLLKPGTEAIVGAAALREITGYHFTKAFLGANGISPRQGYTTPDNEEAVIKAKAVELAYMTYVLADHSKFGLVTAITVCPLEKACIISDRPPDAIYGQHTHVKAVEETPGSDRSNSSCKERDDSQ